MTKPTIWPVRPAKTQISPGIHPVWSESLLSAWRNIGLLTAKRVHSEDSDQTQADQSLRWTHMPLCWFCHAAAGLRWSMSLPRVMDRVWSCFPQVLWFLPPCMTTITLLATSFKSMFYAYHHSMNKLHTNIFLSIHSTNFVLKCAAKEKENLLTIKNFTSKNNF